MVARAWVFCFSSWWGAWVSCFSINEGMGCVSSYASGEVEKEKLSWKRRFKIFFFPASAYTGNKNMHSAV